MSISLLPNPLEVRTAEYPIEDAFLKRWSPRALSGEFLSDDELFTLFEAARWAPSTYNEQEWRFLYAKRDTDDWQLFFDLLAEANQIWCERASHLVVVLARKTFLKNGKPNPVHVFDVGAAFQNLLLQASAMDLVGHGMAGFDFDKARTDLNVPEEFALCAMLAVGRPGNPEDLPEHYRAIEIPSQRKPIDLIARAGSFQFEE